MDTTGVIQLVSLGVLVFLSAFFSSAETAFSTVNRVRLRTLAEEDHKGAIRVLAILDQYGKMLSAILIGNNIVNLSASSLMTTFAISLWGNRAVGIATGVLTFVILMFGEIIPKTWAMQRAEPISLLFGPLIRLLMTILTPVIFLVDKLAGGQGGKMTARESAGDYEKEQVLNHLLLRQLLDSLSEKEQELIKMRYFQDKTQSEVAGKMGISQVQVSRMEKKILLRMRGELMV